MITTNNTQQVTIRELKHILFQDWRETESSMEPEIKQKKKCRQVEKSRYFEEKTGGRLAATSTP